MVQSFLSLGQIGYVGGLVGVSGPQWLPGLRCLRGCWLLIGKARSQMAGSRTTGLPGWCSCGQESEILGWVIVGSGF